MTTELQSKARQKVVAAKFNILRLQVLRILKTKEKLSENHRNNVKLSTVCAHCTSNKNQHALMLFNGNRFRHTASSVQVYAVCTNNVKSIKKRTGKNSSYISGDHNALCAQINPYTFPIQPLFTINHVLNNKASFKPVHNTIFLITNYSAC